MVLFYITSELIYNPFPMKVELEQLTPFPTCRNPNGRFLSTKWCKPLKPDLQQPAMLDLLLISSSHSIYLCSYRPRECLRQYRQGLRGPPAREKALVETPVVPTTFIFIITTTITITIRIITTTVAVCLQCLGLIDIYQ